LRNRHPEIERNSAPISQSQVDITTTPNDYHILTTLEFNGSLMKEAFDSPLSIAQQEVWDVGIVMMRFLLIPFF
jgi:hypothetical protein